MDKYAEATYTMRTLHFHLVKLDDALFPYTLNKAGRLYEKATAH
jgi:hypothetical protein